MASAHYEAALALERPMKSTPLVARMEFGYGKLLLDHDGERARRLLVSALPTAVELGMEKLAADAGALPS